MTTEEMNAIAMALFEQDAWGQHRYFPRQDWQYEVANDDTQVGYWEWLSTKLDNSDEEEEECA